MRTGVFFSDKNTTRMKEMFYGAEWNIWRWHWPCTKRCPATTTSRATWWRNPATIRPSSLYGASIGPVSTRSTRLWAKVGHLIARALCPKTWASSTSTGTSHVTTLQSMNRLVSNTLTWLISNGFRWFFFAFGSSWNVLRLFLCDPFDWTSRTAANSQNVK